MTEPIVPIAPQHPGVFAVPAVGRPRAAPEERERRRREREEEQADAQRIPGPAPRQDDDPDADDGRPHIDVIA